MSHQSMSLGILKEWSYSHSFLLYEKNGWKQLFISSSHVCMPVDGIEQFYMRFHDGDISPFIYLVSLLVMEYFLKISPFFLFPYPTHNYHLNCFFSHQICPPVTPTHKCENDLIWTVTYAADKFHHGWVGDLLPNFLSIPLIMIQTNFLFSVFSSLSVQK